MKILVVGPFASAQRDAAIAAGFKRCGCDVAECGYGDLLFSDKIVSRVQFRLGVGPVFSALKERVIDSVRSTHPDVILFRRPLEFSAAMMRDIRSACPAIYASFNNDDPFSPSYTDVRWRSLRMAIPEFDVHFAFRARNIEQYRSAGAKSVALWEPFYTPWVHRPLSDGAHVRSEGFNLLFAMHAERDERRDALLALIAKGVSVDIHSWNWASVFGKQEAKRIGVKAPVWENEYVRAIGDASATLCFFSKQNNDELTSRVFEIPACKGLLLSWRTPRLEQIFKDREEAFFFSSVDELLDVVEILSNDPSLVIDVKNRGYDRLLKSRHSIVDRCADAINVFQKLM
jgi:spore maturation protein CgeB